MSRLVFVTAVIVTGVALVPEHAGAQGPVRYFGGVPHRFSGDVTLDAAPLEFNLDMFEAPPARELQQVPPLAIGQDPADSLYNLARTALIRNDHERAAQLFHELRTRFPSSPHAPDSYYWEAFALYRSGNADDLQAALRVLQLQRERHPDAAARGDAPSLTVRINGTLARRGDAEAAVLVARAAELSARSAMTASEQGPLQIVADTPRVVDADVLYRGGLHELRSGQEVYLKDVARTALANAQALMQRQLEAARLQSMQSELNRVQAEAAALELRSSGVWYGPGQDDPQCPSNEQETRIAALNALVQMDADRAVPVLRRLLSRRDPCSRPLRRRAVFLVAQTQAAEAEAILLNTVQNDPDPEVRRQAVLYLSRIPSERSVQLLQQILLTADDAAIQNRAVIALASHQRQDGRRALLRVVQRGDLPEKVRVTAIHHLSRNASEAELAMLRNTYARSQSLDVKEAIVDALGEHGRAEDQAWIMRLARDGSEPIALRKKAIFLAGGGGVPLDQLAGLYDQLTAPELREQLILALSQRDEEGAARTLERIARTEQDAHLQGRAAFWYARTDADLAAISRLYDDLPARHVREPLIAAFARREALDRLIEIARSDDDVALRRAAIEWLGRSGDPRALHALLELVER